MLLVTPGDDSHSTALLSMATGPGTPQTLGVA
jgi:hypothetical protein